MDALEVKTDQGKQEPSDSKTQTQKSKFIAKKPQDAQDGSRSPSPKSDQSGSFYNLEFSPSQIKKHAVEHQVDGKQDILTKIKPIETPGTEPELPAKFMQLYNVMIDNNVIEFQKDILRRVQMLESDSLRKSIIEPVAIPAPD